MKHLLGESAAEEAEQISRWLQEDPANLLYYDGIKKVWETSQQLASVSKIDENKAWKRFQKRIKREEENKKNLHPVGWMKIAASVILIIGLSITAYWMFDSKKPVEMFVQSQQSVLKDTLPDGSVAIINKESSISYPSVFKGNTRNIKLKGEAFFNVTPDKKKPFIISVNDIKVTVVGTSFNVKSIDGNTEVIVESGIVKVTKGEKTVELKANEKLMVEAQDSTMVKEKVGDHLYNYYRTKEFVCNDTPLWKLIDILNKAYNTNIIFSKNELKDLRLNTTFNNESLDQVLTVISLTFNIKIIRETDKIILQ